MTARLHSASVPEQLRPLSAASPARHRRIASITPHRCISPPHPPSARKFSFGRRCSRLAAPPRAALLQLHSVSADLAFLRPFPPAVTPLSASAYLHFQSTRNSDRPTSEQRARPTSAHAQPLINRATRDRWSSAAGLVHMRHSVDLYIASLIYSILKLSLRWRLAPAPRARIRSASTSAWRAGHARQIYCRCGQSATP